MLRGLVNTTLKKSLSTTNKCLLLRNHQIEVSVSTIKREIASLGLKRKNIKESNIKDIVTVIIEELHSCGYNLGYRALRLKLKMKYKLAVTVQER